ncbi:MAG: hypothetical protein QF637_01175 [Acidimicrobiales bacterium]|nr:hypothetical protein [Acidimicrobiales bacterium]
MARPKKPKTSKKQPKPKLDGLPDNFRKAIEAKQSKAGGKQRNERSGARNTGYAGGTPKRTGGRDR